MTSSTHWVIHSAWSKAGVGTSFVLELKSPSSQVPAPSSSPISDDVKKTSKKRPARIALDMGATPCFDDAIPAKYVFLSHGHIDHVGALFSHARAHAVSCGGEAPTYFVPAKLLPQIEQCRNAMSLLDSFTILTTTSDGYGNTNKNSTERDNLLKMTLVPVQPGDEFPLKGLTYGSKTSFFMRSFEVDHAGHTALGYIIGSRTKSISLKPEYQNLDGASIRKLVQSGVTVQVDPIEQIEVAYTGDTCKRGLMKDRRHSPEANVEQFRESVKNLNQAFQAELLICELTFLDSTEDEFQRRKSEERGHLHICDLNEIFASHGRLEKPDESKRIIFYHLSGRYSPALRALDYIAAGLPSELRRSCHVAIMSHLSENEKSSNHGMKEMIQPNGCILVEDYIRWKEENNMGNV